MIDSHFPSHFALLELPIVFLNPGFGLGVDSTTHQILLRLVVLVELGLWWNQVISRYCVAC